MHQLRGSAQHQLLREVEALERLCEEHHRAQISGTSTLPPQRILHRALDHFLVLLQCALLALSS